MTGEETLPPQRGPQIEGHTDFEPIGQGGSAEVFRAREIAFDRLVAVKLFGARLDGDAAAREFRRECLAIGQVGDHPSIVRVYSAGSTTDGRPYLTMELMEGSFAEQVAAGPLPAKEVLAIGVAISDAVAAAHRAGVLHRDIKPANVLRNRFGAPVLADFGVSLVASSTTTESQLGLTLEHAAPEVLRGLPSTERSDVYSLASCLFQLSTGFAPFAQLSREPGAVLVKLAHERPPDPGADVLPPELESVLLPALERDPELRPASAALFRDALVAAASRLDGTDPAASVQEVPRRTRRTAVAAAACACVALLGGGLWFASARSTDIAESAIDASAVDDRDGATAGLDPDELIQQLSVMVGDGAPEALGPHRQCVTAQFDRLRSDALSAMVTGGPGSRSNIAAMRDAWAGCGFDSAKLAPFVAAGDYSSAPLDLADNKLECIESRLAEGYAGDIAAVASLTTSAQSAILDRYVDDQLSAATAVCSDPAELTAAFAERLRSDGADPGLVSQFESCAPQVLPVLGPDEIARLGVGLTTLDDGPLADAQAGAREMLATNIVSLASSGGGGGVQLGSGQSVAADGTALPDAPDSSPSEYPTCPPL